MCNCENGRHLEIIVDTSVTVCDENVNATDSISINVANIIPRNMANAISRNVTSNRSNNSDHKKVRYKMDCYILHTVLLVIILSFTIAIVWYHYAKHRSKQKQLLAP